MLQGRVLLLSERDITVKPYVYGEDYYIQTLAQALRTNGVFVGTAIVSEDGIRLYEGETTKLFGAISEVTRHYNTVILHNLSPFVVWATKCKDGPKIMMPIYFLWHSTYSTLENIRNRIGVSVWQVAVDGYLVASPDLVRELRLQGVFRPIYLIPPVYHCSFCDFSHNQEKLRRLRSQLPTKVRVTYLGWLDDAALSLRDVIRSLNKDGNRTYQVRIYTLTPVPWKTFQNENVTVRIISKILSDQEKCEVLSRSDLFIAPLRDTTMLPPVSVIEAEYHGNIVVDTQHLKHGAPWMQP